ncbi:MAG: DMT family transporter [Pseudomonadota bacterium]
MSHQPPPASTLVPFALLIFAMATVGVNVPAGKVIATEFPVLVFLSVRFAIALAALCVIAQPSVWTEIRAIERADMWPIVWIALFGSILFTVFILEGAARTTATSAGLITATLPAVATAMGVMFLRQPLTRIAAACVGLAVTGLVVMQAGEINGGAGASGSSVAPLLGNALVLAAVLCEASYVIISGRAAARLSPIALSLVVSAVALLGSLPLTLWNIWTTGVPELSTRLAALMVWYALIASVVSTIAWYAGARRASAWQAAVATAALPLAAVAASTLVLGETLTLAQAIGGGFVLAALGVGAYAAARSSDSAVATTHIAKAAQSGADLISTAATEDAEGNGARGDDAHAPERGKA